MGPGQGVKGGVVGISTDITERIETENELRRREALLAEAQELAHLGSWDWELPSGRVRWSDECYRIVGRDPKEFVPTFDSLLSCVHPDDRQRMRAATDAALSTGEYSLEHRVTRPDGEVRVVSARGRVEFDGDGTALRMVCAVLDVTERKEAERELEWRALHDPLTHLPNRTLLMDRLAQALRAADRHAETPGVLFLDIDRFKSVNDELGHEAGDELLIVTGRRLREALRAGDTLARVGGDEFVAVCEDVSTEEELMANGERMRRRFADPFEIGGEPRKVSASIGVALAGSPDEDPGRLIQRADRAMYAAKQHGRDRVEAAGDGD
jgi:diguanylate cyclase (GGDEF)-like protein/PAS domain S-box-containing protein